MDACSCDHSTRTAAVFFSLSALLLQTITSDLRPLVPGGNETPRREREACFGDGGGQGREERVNLSSWKRGEEGKNKRERWGRGLLVS
jgi:hypothetical protein